MFLTAWSLVSVLLVSFNAGRDTISLQSLRQLTGRLLAACHEGPASDAGLDAADSSRAQSGQQPAQAAGDGAETWSQCQGVLTAVCQALTLESALLMGTHVMLNDMRQ